MNADRTIAYFSMEVGLDPKLPTYSGGLGVLAGDTLRAGADLRVPMVGVSLIHRQGHLRQVLGPDGEQTETPQSWSPEEHVEDTGVSLAVPIDGRSVQLRVWEYRVVGHGGFVVPVYLLDADLPANTPGDRALTDHLYGGDLRYRLSQEILLGIGGVKALEALGLEQIKLFHMNEGHSALLTLAHLERRLASGSGDGTLSKEDVAAVRSLCVFTTHTPVPAGHDEFSWELVHSLLSSEQVAILQRDDVAAGERLDLTHLALNLSHFVNGVAMRHGQVSRDMFPGREVDSITNGVHPVTWTSEPFRRLFDYYIPHWRESAVALRSAVGIPVSEVVEAHSQAKWALLVEVEKRTGTKLDPEAFTIGFARRSTEYKRSGLVFSDIARLRSLSKRYGPIQLIFAGKAHPNDGPGRAAIKRVYEAATALQGDVPVVYLEDYDMTLGALMTAGTDLWLNTPLRPLEASGTSGMKAALNGVPSLSVLDGWWIEGHIEGVTGWALGVNWRPGNEDNGVRDAESLYQKLEHAILPLFRQSPEAYGYVMQSAIAFNGSFFNAHRMMQEYREGAYRAGR